MNILKFILVLVFSLPYIALAGEPIQIRLIVDEEVLTAVLEDNPTSRDFAKMLPLKLAMRDYNGTEKICNLPGKLSTKDSSEGFNPSIGDITLYAPWGNLAIFYRDFTWSKGLIHLGRITSGMNKLASLKGDFELQIEKLK